MAKAKKLCIRCHSRPAVVPDRERTGRPIARICRECHAQRLVMDMLRIVESHTKEEAKP